MSAAALIPSLIPLFVVAAMRRAEARIRRQLDDARAFSAESAIELSHRRSFDRRRLEGLIQGGAVRVAGNGRHFLDTAGWEAYRGRRRQRVLFALSVVIALLGTGVVLFLLLR